MDPDASRIAAAVLARLDQAWNAADGEAFAAEFTTTADVVNLFGTHIRGRAATAERMQHIFQTIFKGSRHGRRELEQARFVAETVVLAISSATVEVPQGPLAPAVQSRQSFILVEEGGAWRITAWHNTRLSGPPERGSA